MGSGDLRCLLHVKVTSPTPSEESWTSLRPVIRGENIHRNSTASSFWRRAIYFIFFILWKNNWLIMSLIFGVQQSYSVIHTHTHTLTFFYIFFFHYGLSQNTEYSSLCCTQGLAVYPSNVSWCASAEPNAQPVPPPPFQPLATISLFSMSVSLFLLQIQYLNAFLMTRMKRNHLLSRLDFNIKWYVVI